MPPRSNSSDSLFSVMYEEQWNEHSEPSDYECEVEALSSKFKTRANIRHLSRSVTFSDNDSIFLVEHINDLTDDEVAAVWYNKVDFDNMKQEIAKTVYYMETGERIIGVDQTIRGLEYRTRAGAWLKFQNKREAYCAVLDEQDRQWNNDLNDWDTISKVYIEHSEKCAQVAVAVAHRDEAQARRIYGTLHVKKCRNTRTMGRLRQRVSRANHSFGDKSLLAL